MIFIIIYPPPKKNEEEESFVVSCVYIKCCIQNVDVVDILHKIDV